MAQGTDLFNSTKGQFGEYTTLIGEKIPDTTSWFLDKFETTDNITVTSGSIVASNGLAVVGSPSSAYEFYQDQKSTLQDCVVVVEYQTGSSTTDAKIGVFGRETSGDFVFVTADNFTGQLSVTKRESGTDTILNDSMSGDNFLMAPDASYWLVVMFVGDHVRGELWSQDPRLNSSPLCAITHTLSGGDETTFDVQSKIGITEWSPQNSDARIKSLEVGRAFEDDSTTIEDVLAKSHVDIRDFINYRYPIRFRSIKELNDFKITEKAFSQTITLDAPVTGGTFSLYFYPSDDDPYVPISVGSFNYDASNEEIKTELNQVLNTLPKFTVTSEDPIKNVQSMIASDGTALIEFNESFGEISLLRMYLGDLTPSVISEESYDSSTKIGTFYPTIFDADKYIESADPLNKQLTLDDLRIEYKNKNENWTMYNGSGGTSAPAKSYFRDGDLIVGKILSEDNRRGAQLFFSRAMKRAEKTVGQTWSVILQSFSKSVNCKTIGDPSGLHISIMFADFPWDEGTNQSVLDITSSGCYVQFTSHPLGLFADQNGSSDADSATVPFETYLNYTEGTPGSPNSSDVEFIAPMTDFDNSNFFNFSSVTGVRIFLKSAMVSEEATIKIMAIRSITQSRVDDGIWIANEINTLEQNLSAPVLGYTQTEDPSIPMIAGARLDTIASDPSPIDSRQALIFQTGLGLSTDYNKLMIFSREQEYDDVSRSTWLTAEYLFNLSPDSSLLRYKTTRVKSSPFNEPWVAYWDVHPGGVFEDTYSGETGISNLPTLSPEANYEFATIVSANNIGVQIQELTSAEQPQSVIYDAPAASSKEWNSISGRIGWYVEFADKDMSVSAFDLESAAYAVLRTKQFISETPIEGAQLFTVDSGEKNLFESFSPLSTNDQVGVDNQKTSSGLGSYVFNSTGETKNPGIISNQFTVNDWSHLYIEFDIWVPRELKTSEKRPRFALRPVEQPEGTSGADEFSGIVPLNAPVAFDFVPGAWSHVSFDMRGTNAKNGDYYLVVFSNGNFDPDQSSFRNKWWIDGVKINTQTIEWEIRAIENGSWTPFRKNVNRQYGAVHIPETQIGKNIQLQAKALTEDAWIAEYTLIPKYLSIGRLYEQSLYTATGVGVPMSRESDLFASPRGTSSLINPQMRKYTTVDGHVTMSEEYSVVSSVSRPDGDSLQSSSDFFVPRPARTLSDSSSVLGRAKATSVSKR